jgi:hypothetical protein
VKKSTKVAATQARTTTKMKEQRIEWTRNETVGIDLGDRFSYFCALDASGAVVTHHTGSDRVALQDCIAKEDRHRSRDALAVDQPPSHTHGT